MTQNIIEEIDDDSFENKVIKSNKPVLVDFWAPWCGPCKAIAPNIADLAKVYKDKMNFVKINVDENPVSPSKFSITSIPTLIFFKSGKKIDQIIGMTPKPKLEEAIKKNI
ncbi:MAG: thioredoxin [Desulfobacteraceae bacterium 4572_130]|nr:MAG: thioredoxin [Desulfobacteraceae bacterium 4572_130]